MMHASPDFPHWPARIRAYRMRAGRQRGIALVTTLVLLFLLGITAAGLMSLVGNTITAAQRRTDMTEAFNMADTGLDLGRTWLTQQAAPPDPSALSFSGNTFYGTSGTLTNPFNLPSEAGAKLKVTIDADNTNVQSVQKHYLVECTATMPSGATQTLRAYVQQSSFGKYAYFAVNDGGDFGTTTTTSRGRSTSTTATTATRATAPFCGATQPTPRSLPTQAQTRFRSPTTSPGGRTISG